MKLRWLYRFIGKTFYIEEGQVPKVLYHGVLLACIIAGFWLLDSLKDPVLSNTIGMEYQPIAKLLSVVTTLIVVCIYDFLTSVVGKPMLFHIISVVYCVIMLVLSTYLADDIYGLGNAKLGPDRYLGWVTYCLVESYGSLTVALFWSFTNSVMNLEDAKGAYGLIIAIAQFGAILGSTFAAHAATLTIPGLFILASIFILVVSLLVKAYHIIFRDYTTQSMRSRVRSISESSVDPFLPPIDPKASATQPNIRIESSSSSYLSWGLGAIVSTLKSFERVLSSFYEGLYLIGKYPYVLKLLAVSCLYDLVVVILDYEFKITGAKHTINPELLTEQIVSDGHITDRFANLLGHFGQMTNLISLLLSLCGFSFIVHTIGIQKSLMVFPFTLLVAVVIISLIPNIWILFFFVSLLKGMVFSLHDPAKELLYIPTTEGIKYKAKAWIDVFGSRVAKALGSMITFSSFGNIDALRTYSEIPLLVVTGIVIYLTWSIGNDFQELVDKHRIVGEDFSPSESFETKDPYRNNPMVNGLKPGDVGYTGYDPQLFEGVWEEEEAFTYNIDDLQDQEEEYDASSNFLLRRFGNRPFEHSREMAKKPPLNAYDYFGKTREELFGAEENPRSASTGLENAIEKVDSPLDRNRTQSSHF